MLVAEVLAGRPQEVGNPEVVVKETDRNLKET
jgi:hypothetical protein